MKPQVAGLVIVVLVAVIAIGVYAATSSGSPPPSTTSSTTTTTTQTTSSTTTPTEQLITISNFTFVPSTVTVSAGTTVTWRNGDPTVHTVDSDIFHSPNLSQGDTYSFTFNTRGTFDYICAIHPSMKGTIVVE